MEEDHAARLKRLFNKDLVLDLPTILQAFPGRSRCSIFRDLKAVGGHLSSYNHNSRFFTLPDVARFDADGLWQHQGVFFSRYGTLRATVRQLVQMADAGLTHSELERRLYVRVHNTLLDLVRRNEIAREQVDKLFLYVHIDGEVRINQIARRRQQMEDQRPVSPVGSVEIIEVLLDVIRFREQEPGRVFSRLRDKGLGFSLEQVEAVFDRYDLGKKNSPSGP